MHPTYMTIVVMALWKLPDLTSKKIMANFCPRNTTSHGNKCWFILDPKGTFSENLEMCRKREAGLLTLSSVQSLEDACKYIKYISEHWGYAFLGADQNPNDTSEYTWHNSKRKVDFPQKYWLDTTPDHLRCLEVYSFGEFCRINDIVCLKESWPICEIHNENPCLEDNGNCQDTCIPREFRVRTCKCDTGKKVNETRCVNDTIFPQLSVCPDGYTYVKHFTRAGDCVQLREQTVDHLTGSRECQNAKSNPFTFGPQTLSKACNYARSNLNYSQSIWMGASEYNADKGIITWMYDNKNDKLSNYIHVDTAIWTDDEAGAKALILSVDGPDCIIYLSDKMAANYLVCQHATIPNPCKQNNGGCPEKCIPINSTYALCMCHSPGYLYVDGKCVDIDECKTNNGECHHFCHNTVGGVNCSCRDGYSLDEVYHTECEIECNHQNESEEYVVTDGFRCGCLPGYKLIDYNVCRSTQIIQPQIAVNNTDDGVDEDDRRQLSTDQGLYLFDLLWIILAVIILSGFIFSIIRRKLRRRGVNMAGLGNRKIDKPFSGPTKPIDGDTPLKKVDDHGSEGTSVDTVANWADVDKVSKTASAVDIT